MRGFVFALLFVSFFSLLLGTSLFYASSVRDLDSSALAARQAQAESSAADDVAWDLLSFFGLNLSVSKSESASVVSISSSIPAPYANASAELDGYRAFLQADYFQAAHANATLGAVGSWLFFGGLGANYSWVNESRPSAKMAGGPAAGYSLAATLGQECAAVPCSPEASGWAWVACGPGTVSVSLAVTDAYGNAVEPGGSASGCVSASVQNSFSIATAGGALNVSAGALGGDSPAFGLSANGTLSASFALSSNFSSAPAIAAYLPANLAVGGQEYAALAVLQD